VLTLEDMYSTSLKNTAMQGTDEVSCDVSKVPSHFFSK
jgi:hypothetical protein